MLGLSPLPGAELGLGGLGHVVPRTRCRLVVEENTPVRVLDAPQVCPRVIKGSMKGPSRVFKGRERSSRVG